MKEKVDFTEEINETETPVLGISVTNLEITVEEGKVYKGSFVVESRGKVPVRGIVRSTNDKVGLETEEFEGVRTEISYYFKGKLATAGNEFEGDFLLITDGGEYNIPYRILVVPTSVDTSVGEISNMEDFTKLYYENRQEAMELFFLPNFADVFLRNLPEQKELYHGLMKSRSRSMILEEFLCAAGYKEPTCLTVEKEQITLDAGKEQEKLVISLTQKGYVEGKIKAEKGQVTLSVGAFTSEDFAEGRLELILEKNHNYTMGSDVIRIVTMRQEIAVRVEWWGTLPEYTKEREKKSGLKKQRAELMHNYLSFRTGSIGFEDFADEAVRGLEELSRRSGEVEWKLYLLQIFMMEERQEEAKELFEAMEAKEGEQPFSPLLHNYFLYLKALLLRTPESISAAVLSIREFYEASERKAEALWMLIYLDREYVYNKRLRYDTIKQLFQQGENSSLLYFEACDLLNDNPDYMEELGSFEISVFRWGVRYGYVSMSLAYQFARLALKAKYFSKAVYHIAEKLYQVEPDERFLQVICSLLIKGNRHGREYHGYFRQAVEANLKIIGLNEFFIRSMDFSEYEVIPHRVLIYFTYSNSLDSTEKAYLYSNVLENKTFYDEVYGAYYAKMLPFVEEQLLKGRMNEHLAYLYSYFQKEILEKPANTKAVCDILFYQKLTCLNKNMIGVYVARPETGEETYYPLAGGICYVEIPNGRTILYFVDSREQRYVTGIDCEKEPFLLTEQFPKGWLQKNMGNKKILLALSYKVDGDIRESDLPVLQKVAFQDGYQPWIRMRAAEKLLIYYEGHQRKEELAIWLERMDYSNVSAGFRKRLMDFYMEVGMMEEAYFGIELYGCGIMGAAKRLKLASFGVVHSGGNLDETTLSLAYSAFVSKKYNRDTLSYLMRHFEGETEDLLLIWERSRKFGLDTTDFEKKMLRQSMFTGNDTDGLFAVLESLCGAEQEREMTGEYLRYLSERERQGLVELPASVHVMIGEEILAGRIRDQEAQLHFLWYFADKEPWKAKIRETAVMLIHRFLREELYLPVFYAYRDWVSFPAQYVEKTFLTYRGSRGSNVVLYYQIEGEEERTRKCRLEEFLPGIYVCSMHFYQNDHVNYRLEENEALVEDESRLSFETFEYEGEESRFFALNHFGGEDWNQEEFEYYLKKAYFAEHVMGML